MEQGFISILKAAFGLQQGVFMLLMHMCLRGLVIYIFSIVLIRFNRRFTGIRTPFNFIVFIMLGSISAAAVTGDAPFFPVVGVITFLVLINRIVAAVVFRFPSLENFLKGPVVLLAKKGKIQWEHMRKNNITKRDLFTELRDQMQTDDLSSVDFAFLATDGEINFVKRDKSKS